MHPSRRSLLAGAGGAAALAALPASASALSLPGIPVPDLTDPLDALDSTGALTAADRAAALAHEAAVPEIFRAPQQVASHTEVIVVGTGFGASVSALRLGQAGARVAMLERGSRWPRDPWRRIHATDTALDGRGVWHKRSIKDLLGLAHPVDKFGGVLDDTIYEHLRVWRGAAVGGGSIVFTGVLLEPPKDYFEHLFGSTVSQREMHQKWYPKARTMLKASPMPDDIYQAPPFGHSRRWDKHAHTAGYEIERLDGIWDWGVVRKELQGRSRRSATIGESNYGNANGAKWDLTLNYLPTAEATGKVTVHHWHVVDRIGQDRRGRYTVDLRVVDPTGLVLQERTVTCDRLVLGAGSVGTSELLVRAKAEGTLRHLDDSVGEGFGTNGDAAMTQFLGISQGLAQGSPSASTIIDRSGDIPARMENWYTLGLQVNAGILGSLGMAMDPAR
ncbi:MAG: hypothetical protein L0G89_12690, partial [Janibacter sp.]|nr:hypothetical protein [Janibacter sp.]